MGLQTNYKVVPPPMKKIGFVIPWILVRYVTNKNQSEMGLMCTNWTLTMGHHPVVYGKSHRSIAGWCLGYGNLHLLSLAVSILAQATSVLNPQCVFLFSSMVIDSQHIPVYLWNIMCVITNQIMWHPRIMLWIPLLYQWLTSNCDETPEIPYLLLIKQQ